MSATTVVIGGGIIGSAIAWRLAREDVDVVLLERNTSGRASSAAAGMLAPLKEAEDVGPFLQLGLRSMERYPAFVAAIERASGMDVGFRRDGRLDVALDDEGADALRRQHELQGEAGFDSRLLTGKEVRSLEPGLAADIDHGLLTDHDHQVDAPRLTAAVRAACAAGGVDVREGAAAKDLLTDGDPPTRVRGVALDSGGAVEAERVVLAAGAWSRDIPLPHTLPIRPVRGQIVVLRTREPVLLHTLWLGHTYLVPRTDGRLLVGSTMEDVGFDTRTTAAAVHRLLGRAQRLVPALAEAAVEGFQVGLRPASDDGLPVMGPDPRVAGLYHATGHFRNGILLAPETAERMAAIILDGEAPEPGFDPGRFLV